MLMGDPEGWLVSFRSLEECLVEALEFLWPSCVLSLQPKKGSMTHEDPITFQIVTALKRSKRFPGRIIPQYSLLSEDVSGVSKLSSNIDFVLTIGDDEDVYLACECKRLNVPYKSGTRGLVGEYVDEGLMRFVTEQYSSGLPLAMMLGYVMDARLAAAHRGLRRAMRVREKAIGLRSVIDHPVRPRKPLRFRTRHGGVSSAALEVSHILLAWP
jgi:hypothetical protein